MLTPTTKRTSVPELRQMLGREASIYKRSLARRGPQNLEWNAAELEGLIPRASTSEKIALFWSLAIVLQAAGQEGRAIQAARMHLRLRPPNELDRAHDNARAGLKRLLAAARVNVEMDDRMAALAGIPIVDANALPSQGAATFKDQVRGAFLRRISEGAFITVVRVKLDVVPGGVVATFYYPSDRGPYEDGTAEGRTPEELAAAIYAALGGKNLPKP